MSRAKFQNIVILTGAGISAESGIDTFRDEGGIWSRYNIEDVATPEGFKRNPNMVHDFHNQLRALMPKHKPNEAHKALAKLEKFHYGNTLLVTQNVDDLHERAGTKNLIHMHGELYKARCQSCDTLVDWRAKLGIDAVCPGCSKVGFMRPHVTWFYEMPMEMERINGALLKCDLFLSIGTSGNVYPAAGFINDVKKVGRARTVELNLEPSENATSFFECRHGPATKIVPDFVEEILRYSS